MEEEIANYIKLGKLIPKKEIFKYFNSVIENINNDKVKKN